METQTGTLTSQNLVCAREVTYFYVLLAVSIFIWLCVAISIIGLFIAAILAVVTWFTHGLLVARLRSESVLITPQQYPDLHASFVEVCQRLGLDKVPSFIFFSHLAARSTPSRRITPGAILSFFTPALSRRWGIHRR